MSLQSNIMLEILRSAQDDTGKKLKIENGKLKINFAFCIFSCPQPSFWALAKNLLNSGDHWSPLHNPSKTDFIVKRLHPSEMDFIAKRFHPSKRDFIPRRGISFILSPLHNPSKTDFIVEQRVVCDASPYKVTLCQRSFAPLRMTQGKQLKIENGKLKINFALCIL